jgi:hypothetical protein
MPRPACDELQKKRGEVREAATGGRRDMLF